MKKAGKSIVVVALFLSSQALAGEQTLHAGTGNGDLRAATGNGRVLSVGGYQNGNDRSHGHDSDYNNDTSQGGYNADVVVDLPPEAWTKGQNGNQPPCLRCCTYENRSYTEGAVVKMEGVLLQCRRDEHAIGTNNLIWQTIK